MVFFLVTLSFICYYFFFSISGGCMLKFWFLFAFSLTTITAKGNEENIPVVDFRDYVDHQKREGFLQTVRVALKEYGFFTITNTGIDASLTKHTYSLCRWFFAKPIEEKMLCHGIKTNCQRGYIPFGYETAKGKTLADHKEFFHVGIELDAKSLCKHKYWANIWPKETFFRQGCLAFRKHLMAFSLVMQEILAKSLQIEPCFFSKKTLDGDTLLRMIHYPSVKESDVVGDHWAAEHTDINLFTILPVASSNGLEVKTRSGKWIRAKGVEDSFIINAGDFLQIYTNGLYQSSVHRVRRCHDNANKDRYSMVMFVHPRSDVILDPLECCIKKTGGKKLFATATRYEMLMERLTDLGQANDTMLKELSASGVMERLIEVGRASSDCMLYLREKDLASRTVLKELEKRGL